MLGIPGIRLRPAIIMTPLLAATMTGCSGSDSQSSAAQASGASPAAAAPATKPQHASAQAMVEYLNSLSTGKFMSLAAMQSFCQEFYAENTNQQRLVRIAQMLPPFLDFNHAIEDRFGRASADSPLLEFDPSASERIRITQTGDQRTSAAYRDAYGRLRSMELVKVGDRWWISGYTLERDNFLKPYSDVLDVIERSRP